MLKNGMMGRIKPGDWAAVRENPELVLNGIPEATPLFLRDAI
jgi:hypothetical protein